MDSPERFTPRGGGSTDYETAGSGWFTHEEMQRLRLHPGFAKTWDSVRRSRIDKEAGYSRKTTCAICGEKARPGDPLTRGHIVPRAAGGSDEPWNIRPEHESCNAARANSYTRDDAAEAERRRHQKEAASGYNLSKRSGMISLDVPESAALAHPSGVIRDHHITVAYLGKDVDDDAYERACKRASEAAASLEGPFAVTLGSLGTFPPSDSSDHKVPVYLHVSPHPALGQLRSQLEDLSASEHKDWKPHVTLAYIEPGEPLPPRGRPQHVGFGHLSVHRGEDEVRRFRLGDGAES